MARKNKKVTPVRLGTKDNPVVLSYPHLVEPQEMPCKPGEKPRPPQYSCVVVLSKEQVEDGMLDELKKIAAEARDHFFGGTKPRGLRSPFRKNEEMWEEGPDGKLIPAVGYPAGGMFVALKAGDEKPDCRDEQMRVVTDAAVLYPGCKVNAICTAYGYDFAGNKGVSIGLGCLQKVGDGDNIAGRISAADYFDKVESLTDNATTGATTGDGWDDNDDEEIDENY